MKHLLLLLIVCFVGPALAFDIGTYTWIGVGCRDRSLSEDSHVTKAMSSNSVGVEFATFTFTRNTASMYAIIEGDLQEHTGNYEQDGSQINILAPEGEELFSFRIVEDTLVLVARDTESSDRICGSDKVYVFVLANVS